MFTCTDTDRFTTRILAGLVLAVTIVVGSLTHAVTNIQTFA
ncbi:MAG TPA: hypothetical protein VF851_01100 [Steroidobacteraceae bacterium]|jgi:hypothetical protein